MDIYRYWVIEKLANWMDTFVESSDSQIEGSVEHSESATEMIGNLITSFEEGTSSKEDYENILFHLWQINHGGGLAFEDED